MSRSIQGAILALIFFLPTYCACFWFGIMPKFYPLLGEVRFVPPEGKHIAVKFVGAALVGMLAAVVGYGIGRTLPQRAGVVLHWLVWLVLVGAGAYLVGRETIEYILH